MNDIKLPITNTYKDVRYIPCTEKLRFVTVIAVHNEVDTYHLDIFLEYNTDTDVYIISDNRPNLPGVDPAYKWKTNDVILRNWWQENKLNIKVDKVFYMEYDVLVLTKITDDMFSSGVRSAVPFLLYTELAPDEQWEGKASWWWREDGDKIPFKLKQKACSNMPSCIWANTSALDCLIDLEWDSTYQENIVADIRFSTILNYCNVLLEDWVDNSLYIKVSCHMADIDLDVINKIKARVPGIYHPVKKRIDQY